MSFDGLFAKREFWLLYAWFIVAKEYIREKASLYTGFFGRDHRLKRETDFFFHTATFFKMLGKALWRVSYIL